MVVFLALVIVHAREVTIPGLHFLLTLCVLPMCICAHHVHAWRSEAGSGPLGLALQL